ncbi:hypothetical protein HDV06_000631 [Boothiomyces sp. JEL0866]|nr:hypothetical protein HDV06_000631 [Boothiomyces sp. JEL0866]
MLSILNYLRPRDVAADIHNEKLNQKQNILLENTQILKSMEHKVLGLRDISDLLDGYSRKKWTVSQVLQIYAFKCIQVDKHFNLIGEFMFNEAHERAKYLDNYMVENGKLFGPLHGVPVALSDECIISGVDSSLGCHCNAMNPAQIDSTLVKQLKSLGAIIFCKTNVPWHLLFSNPANPVFGASQINPKPNISGGGRCAALTSLISNIGGVLIGFGTDQSGGVRIPTSHSGVYTIKPTSIRIAESTIYSVWDTIPSTTCPVSKYLCNIVYIMEQLYSRANYKLDCTIPPLSFSSKLYKSPQTKKFTFGYYIDDQIIKASPACKRAVYTVVAQLHQAGHTVIPFQPPLPRDAILLLSKLYALDQTPKCISSSSIDLPTLELFRLTPKIKKLLAMFVGYLMKDRVMSILGYNFGGTSASSKPRELTEYKELERLKNEYTKQFCSYMTQAGIDAIICPNHACPPMPKKSSPFIWPGSFYSSLYNLLDLPCGTIPVTTVSNGDSIPNLLHYTHHDNFDFAKTADFNFLSVVVLDEITAAVNGPSLGERVGVQIVCNKFKDELCLGIMKLVDDSLRNV